MRLSRSEELVKRLQSSEAVLRGAIKSARSTLHLPDVAILVSTPPGSAITDEYTSLPNASPAPSPSDASEQGRGSAMQPATESSTQDPSALVSGDEPTSLTLGVPPRESTSLDTTFHCMDDGFGEL